MCVGDGTKERPNEGEKWKWLCKSTLKLSGKCNAYKHTSTHARREYLIGAQIYGLRFNTIQQMCMQINSNQSVNNIFSANFELIQEKWLIFCHKIDKFTLNRNLLFTLFHFAILIVQIYRMRYNLCVPRFYIGCFRSNWLEIFFYKEAFTLYNFPLWSFDTFSLRKHMFYNTNAILCAKSLLLLFFVQ